MRTATIVTAVMLTVALAVPASAALVSQYKFDETSGTTVHEEVSGADVAVSGDPGFVSGKVANAIDLDGDGDHVVAPVPSGLDSSELTFACWTKFASAASDWGAWWGLTEPGEGRLSLEVHGYAPDNGAYVWEKNWPGASTPKGSTDLAGEWHHVAWTLSESGNVQSIYIDGSVDGGNATGTWASTASISDLVIGGRRKWAGGPVAFEVFGQIDDVQIYDEALSGTDVAWLHDNPGSVIPEPATMFLLGLGGVGLVLKRRRR